MRQGRVFSPSAAKTELKCTSRTPNESSRTRNESLHGRRTQSELTHTLFSSVSLIENEVQILGLKFMTATTKTRRRLGNTKRISVCEHGTNRVVGRWQWHSLYLNAMWTLTRMMFCCHFSTRTNFKIYWRQQQKREEHSGIQKEYLSVNTSRVLGWRWQTFPGL